MSISLRVPAPPRKQYPKDSLFDLLLGDQQMLSLDTTQPSFTKKKPGKRQKRKFADWDEEIMHSLWIRPLICRSSAKALQIELRKPNLCQEAF